MAHHIHVGNDSVERITESPNSDSVDNEMGDAVPAYWNRKPIRRRPGTVCEQ